MRRYASTLAMFASILALVFIKEIPMVFKILILIVGVAGAYEQLQEDYKENQENIRVCKNQEEIEGAMKYLVKSQGKTCIMSRDLSWVNDEIKKILIKKNKNARVFAQEETELTKELISKGVEVHYYGVYGFEPKTRFTIIRYNRDDKQVAIAKTSDAIKKENFEHKIYQTKNETIQDEFICSLATDLMDLCKAACENRKTTGS